MARKHLLLVDADPRSLRVLEISLRKAGYNLATCADATAALETVEYSTPDLILSDTRLPGKTGFELVETIKSRPELAMIPIMFLSSDTSVESKVKGLQLGVEDYLTKPIYIKEIVARINLTLSRIERESVAKRSSISKTRFSGSLADMGLVDLLQTIEMSRKSGVLELKNNGASGMMTFRDGQVLDAELGTIHGERAVYRLLLWNEGEFDIDFRPVRAEQQIQTPMQGLLMEGMRRLDEWGRLLEQIPPLASVLEVNAEEFSVRLSEIPDELNTILKLIDGQRALAEALDLVEGDDLTTLHAISKLYFEGIIQPTGKIRTLRPGSPDPAEPESAETLSPGGPKPDEALVDDASDGDGDSDVVPGGAASVPPPPPDASDDEALEDTRSDVDAERGTIPGQATYSTPPPPVIEAELAQAGTGTDGALVPGPAHRAGRSQTLIGPAFEPSQAAATAGQGATDRAAPGHERGLDFGRTEIGHPPIESQSVGSESDEDAMSKKKRRNRDRAEEREAVKKGETLRQDAGAADDASAREEVGEHEDAAAKKDDAASNVIQFPQKRSSVAVAVGAEDSSVEAASGRSDDTARRTRDERGDTDAPGSSADDAEAPSKKPMPGEVPRVAADKTENAADSEPAAPPSARDRRDERRRKKSDTTSSSEIKAALGTGDHKAVTDDFFAKRQSQPPGADDFSDLGSALEPLPVQSRQWMYGTAAIFCVFALGIGVYWYYHNVHLPPEVALGHTRPVALPTGIARTPDPDPIDDPTLVAVEPVADIEPGADIEPAADIMPGADVVDPTLDVAPGGDVPVADVAPVVDVAPVADVVPPPVAAEPGETYDTALEAARAARGARGIPLYERAIELDPNGVEALAQLSYLLVNRGRGDDMTRAATYAERASSLDPTNSLAWLVLGVARESMRPADREGARAAYRSCVEFGTGRWVSECRPHAR